MKNIIKTAFFLAISVFNFQLAIGQTVLTISGNQVVQEGGYLVIQNTKLINNSTFQANGGVVAIKGDASDANSTIGGTTATTFYNLTIDKTSNNATLENTITVANQLTLSNGHLDLTDSDVVISSTGSVRGGSSSSFIKTSNTGKLIREVGASNVVFPVGYTNYVPVTINNSGTTDNFEVRVVDAVYQNGTSGTEVTTDVLDCTWYIDESTAGGSDVSLTFQWNTADELTNFDRNLASVAHYSNGSWNTYATQTATGSNPYTLTQSGINSFSPFTVSSDAAALPVELLYFYGEKVTEGVLLDWQTVTEINNSHFDVEWSTDGTTFQKIGEVAGMGTTNDVQFYEFLHKTPVVGLNYYRLKQHDFDGEYEYTQIIAVTIEDFNTAQNDNVTINVFPNPASNAFTIQNLADGEMVQIFSANGQFVEEHQAPIINLPITHLPKGTYFLKMGSTVKRLLIH